jgi:Rrf2 family iron-sulfur cluster assembly transcriptional regulator
MVEYLDSVSLRDLVEQQRSKQAQQAVLRDTREPGTSQTIATRIPNSVFDMARS